MSKQGIMILPVERRKETIMSIKEQVIDYIPQEFIADFDIDGIVDEIRGRFPDIQDVDEIDIDEFIGIIKSFDGADQ